MNTDHPIFHAAPTQEDGVTLTPWGESPESMRYFLYRDVLEELVYASEYHEGKVCAALLTGPFGVEREGPFLEVTGFEDFEVWDALTARELFEHLRASMEEHFAGTPTMITATGQSAVGFFVHQPGEAAAFGALHARVHMSLFNVPFQMALLLDVGSDQAALYGRAPGRGFFNAGFVVVEPERLTEARAPDEDAPHPMGSGQEE